MSVQSKCISDYELPDPYQMIKYIQSNDLHVDHTYSIVVDTLDDDRYAGRIHHCSLLEAQMVYDKEEQLNLYNMHYKTMNVDQRHAFDEINQAIATKSNQKLFFIDAPGGTGKTYLLNTLGEKFRAEGTLILMTASSGIAAVLLTGGRTAHSTFKIPLRCSTSSVSSIRPSDKMGKLLQKIELIIWDELPMSHKHAVSCVDRLLQDVKGIPDCPFGGVTMVFAGDFRQTLPVVPKGGEADILQACVQTSSWWQVVRKLRLTINERIRRSSAIVEEEQVSQSTSSVLKVNEDLEAFNQFLLSVGNGDKKLQVDGLPEDMIEIPERHVSFCGSITKDVLSDFIQWVYPDINSLLWDGSRICKRAILSTKNKDVDIINKQALLMMNSLHSSISTHTSADKFEGSEDEAVNYPIDYINSIDLPGVPPHILELKPGAPVILLRNLNPQQGLCNGTRLIIHKAYDRVLIVYKATGSSVKDLIAIPRIDLISEENRSLPFSFRRRQFPVKLAFGMTINKSQGQSLEAVGLYLPQPVFAHGQLYVGLSRATDPNALKLIIEDIPGIQGYCSDKRSGGVFTRNVVYKGLM